MSLNNKNLLINTKNNSSCFLSELQANILRLFFNKQKVKKNEIKTDILKIKISIDSKALETHLYRLRKKLSDINSNISINSISKDYLQIK